MEQHLERLAGVHPRLAKPIHDIVNQLPMFISQGIRTQQEQYLLWLKGRPGGPPGSRIVTMKDGVMHKSDHQVRADGFGHAVDCAFCPTAKLPNPFDERHPWESYGLMVEAAGLRWGGRWSHPHDSPHAELSDELPAGALIA